MQPQLAEMPGERNRSVAPADREWAYRLVLCVLVLGSLGLRLFGIGWGIPHFDPARIATSAYRNSYHIDEDNFLWGLIQMKPSQGNFDVADYHWGTLQFYLIYGALLGGEAVGVVPAPWERDFLGGDIPAISRLYILGRLVSVAGGVICTLLVVALGNLLAGRLAGLGAGAAYAVAPLAVTEAHYLTNDIVMSTFVAGMVLCAALALKRVRLRWLIIAGLLLGLGTADKYSAISAAPAILVAQLLFRRLDLLGQDESRKSTPLLRLITLPWIAVAGGFLLGEPYAMLAPGKLIAGLQVTAQGNAIESGSRLQDVASMLTWQASYVAGLALTWPMALLALAGLLIALWSVVRALRGRSEARPVTPVAPVAPVMPLAVSSPSLPSAAVSLVILTAVAGLVAGLAFNRIYVLRYSQPLLPLLAVLAAAGWAAIPRVTARWAAGGVAWLVALAITLGQLSIMSGPHTVNELLAWLQAHYQLGQTVAQIWPEYPPLDGGSYHLVRMDPWNPQLPQGVLPDYIVLDNMEFAPPSPQVAELLASRYHEVARFQVNPSIGPFSWDEGSTPHDWKYSHPTLTVYAPLK